MRIVRDYLKLKWDFLAESPKYKLSPKKENKEFVTGISSGRKRKAPDRYVAEPAQLYKRFPKYNKTLYVTAESYDEYLDTLLLATSYVSSPLESLSDKYILPNETFISPSLKSSLGSTSCSSSSSTYH